MRHMMTLATLVFATALTATTVATTAKTVKTESLSVTISDEAVVGDNAPYQGLWVGPVTRDGKTETWVELTDQYGEVVYEAIVRPNETHMLRGGHAITVRPLGESRTASTKRFTDRIAPDAKRVATVRITVDPNDQSAKSPDRIETADADGIGQYIKMRLNGVAAIFTTAFTSDRIASR